MGIFIASIFLGFIGLLIGGAIGGTGFLAFSFAIAGFTLPYAITMEKMYHMLLENQEKAIAGEQSADTKYDISTVEINKCPACLSDIIPSDEKCPSCGLELIKE